MDAAHEYQLADRLVPLRLAFLASLLAILATCPASATVIDWAQWTVTSTGTTGTATGSTSGHGTFTGVFTGQTTTFTLPAASSFGLSAFTTVSPPKQFYGILESPTQAGARATPLTSLA